MSELKRLDAGEAWLAHHGIKGQQWGVQNGPPYPIPSGDHSAAEKKAAASKYSRAVNSEAAKNLDASKRMKKALSSKKSGWDEEWHKAHKDYNDSEKALNKIKSKSKTYSKALEKAREKENNYFVSDKEREKASLKVKRLEAGRKYVEQIMLDGAKNSDFTREQRKAGREWLNSTNWQGNMRRSYLLLGLAGGLTYNAATYNDFKQELAENRNTRQKWDAVIDKMVKSDLKSGKSFDDRYGYDSKSDKLDEESKRLRTYLNQR